MSTRPLFAGLMGGWLAFAAGSAVANGLVLRDDQEPWPKLQARISLATAAPLQPLQLPLASTPGLQGGRILGDYYLGRTQRWTDSFSGSFRATSGWLMATHGASLSQPSVPRGRQVLSVSQLSSTALSSDLAEPSGGAAYLGIGYTGLSAKGGWGFTADIGLMASGSGNGLRLARPATSLDDAVRDLRLTPVLQLGLSYSF